MQIHIDLKSAIVFGALVAGSIICFGFLMGMTSVEKQKIISQENIQKVQIENDTQMLKTIAEVWGNCKQYKEKETGEQTGSCQ